MRIAHCDDEFEVHHTDYLYCRYRTNGHDETEKEMAMAAMVMTMTGPCGDDH